MLAKSTAAGDNFQVQVRLSALGGGESSPTYTTEIGIQVGDQKVTFGTDRTATVWVDGVASNLSTSANTLALAGGTISQLSQNKYQITEKTGEVVDITDDGSYFDYTVALSPSAKAGSVEGLLGTYTGTANAFELPDGTVLGSSLTSAQLYQTFGDAWRITDATSLLNYGTGEDTATYTDLAHPDYELPVTSLPTAVVQAATQAVAAAGLTGTAAADAVYDYLATGDPTVITNAAANGSTAPVTSSAVVTPSAPPPPSIGISSTQPSVTETSGQTPVTLTVSLSSVATADTVVNYAVSSTAIDAGKTYFDASDFGGTLPSGSVTILAGQTSAQITVDVPDSALGSIPDKWLAVGISTPSADPIYATTAQVDILNKLPVAGSAAQPVLEYVVGNTVGASQNAPTLTQSGNAYSLNLGNVVQGTQLAGLQFALANMASAPADNLVASVLTANGISFNTTGLQSATTITAGNAYSGLNVQPLTTILGAQSEVVTLGSHDVNATGYNAALPDITLTITENVIAAAQAKINVSSIALPDVRVGSTDTQAITVTNTAATGAASLDVTLGAATGAVGTGSIAQLAPGASNSTSLAVGLATTTAGLQSTFVTLNLASDLGSGVSAPLALNQSVGLTGSVYRSAAATITQAATVVHVGDADSQILSVLNSDPADGYSEGLRATVTGTTGGISASGTTGLIAAGTTDASSISVGYSTAAAGVVSGQVDLGLTSDGTGVDSLAPISLGTDPVSFSVQVDNYATADLHETSGGGTLTGSAATGYSLDLGTIMQGAGPATIDLSALNSASGLADLLSGSFGITGDAASLGAFTNTGFDAFSGLSAGQSDGALSVSLSTANEGTFSETITLTGTGSNGSGYSGTVAPVTLTIHGEVAFNTPVLSGGTIVTGAITELPGETGSAGVDAAQGSIGFTDANLSAAHAASVLGVAASGVTTGLPSNAALLSLLSLGTVSENTASVPGSVAWNFAAADSTFDYLASGQTLTLTYAVKIAEVGGGSVTQNVTVTVTGTNDAPVITSGTTASAAITATGTTTPPATDTASGVIRFSDADLGDTHTATIASVSASGTVAGLPSNAALLALLATTPVTEQAGATPGSVGWNFSAPDATFAYLLPTQAVTLTYAVDVTDNHGATAVQNITVTVTGAPGTVQTSAAPITFAGASYASSSDNYTGSGFRYLETFYDASGNVAATVSYHANGGYTYTVGGVLRQVKTVNADGSNDVRTYSSAPLAGATYAGYDNAYTAAGVRYLETFYDASGNVAATENVLAHGVAIYPIAGVASQTSVLNADGSSTAYYYDASGTMVESATFLANGGFTTTVGGVLRQVKTVNADGSNDVRTYSSAPLAGATYAGYDNAYTAAGVRYLETFYDASGNVAATENVLAHGVAIYPIAGVVSQTSVLNADGSSTAYYYDASGTMVESATFLANGGFTTTVGGVLRQVKTVNADGSNDVRTYSSAPLAGATYAGYDNAYTAAGVRYLETFYDASGNVAATENVLAHGVAIYPIAGVVSQTSVLNADGSSTAYYYDASGTMVESATFLANGGFTTTVGGVLRQVKTVNADGSYVLSSDNVEGQSYTQSNVAHNAAGASIATAQTLTDGSNATTLKASGLTLTVAAGVESVGNGADTFQLGADTHGALDITGAANATLAFGTGDGAQIITGFATSGGGADVLSFNHTVFADYAHLMGATKQQGSDLLITLDASDTLLLKNVTMSSFTTANAHFA